MDHSMQYSNYYQPQQNIAYRKSSFKPPGSYLFFVVLEGGLDRVGDLFLTQDRKFCTTDLLHSLCAAFIETSVLPTSKVCLYQSTIISVSSYRYYIRVSW